MKLSDFQDRKSESKEGKGDLECKICFMKFTIAFSLKRHMKKIHYSIRNSIKCEKCTQTSKRRFTPEEFERHVRICHSDDPKPYKCEICKKAYSTKMLLDRHLGGHGLRPKCKICGHAYNNFEKHMKRKRHDYHCFPCNENFTSEMKFKYHMRKHSQMQDTNNIRAK